MEDAVEQRVLEDALHGQAHDAVPVELGMGHGGVGVADAGHPLHHQHPGGDEAGDGPGHPDVVEAGVLVGQADLGQVQRLEPEVELLQHQLGEQLDEPGQVGDAGPLAQPVGHDGDDRQRPDVGLEPLAQPGPLHLDRHLGAVGQPAQVDLGDAGRGHRHGVDPLEASRPAVAELAVDHPFRRRRAAAAAPRPGTRRRPRSTGRGARPWRWRSAGRASRRPGRRPGPDAWTGGPPAGPGSWWSRPRRGRRAAWRGRPAEPDDDEQQRANGMRAIRGVASVLGLFDDAVALAGEGPVPAPGPPFEAGPAPQPFGPVDQVAEVGEGRRGVLVVAAAPARAIMR